MGESWYPVHYMDVIIYVLIPMLVKLIPVSKCGLWKQGRGKITDLC